MRLGKVDQAALQESLDRGRGRRGQVGASSAVREVSSNPWSEAERVAHRALREAGVTGWVANPRTRLDGGSRRSPGTAARTGASGVRHPDIAFEDVKLAVEIDGRSAHDNPEAFERDRNRHNEFVRAGWVMLHFTRDRVLRDRHSFVAEVTALLVRLRQERPG